MQKRKIFEGVDESTQKEFLNECEIEIFNSWEEIMTQWEETNNKWFIIKSWNVDVIHNGIKVDTLEEWEIFWEIALLNEEERTATIIATTTVETYVITQDKLLEIMNSHSNSLNKEIMRRIEMNLLIEE